MLALINASTVCLALLSIASVFMSLPLIVGALASR